MRMFVSCRFACLTASQLQMLQCYSPYSLVPLLASISPAQLGTWCRPVQHVAPSVRAGEGRLHPSCSMATGGLLLCVCVCVCVVALLNSTLRRALLFQLAFFTKQSVAFCL